VTWLRRDRENTNDTQTSVLYIACTNKRQQPDVTLFVTGNT